MGRAEWLAATTWLPRVHPWGWHMVSAKERAVSPPAPEDFVSSVVKRNIQYIQYIKEVLQG